MTKKANKFQAVKFERRVIDEVQVEPFYGIDLGLPSHRLWASMNVGASFEEDPGYMMDFDTANAIKFKGSWHVPSPEDFKELVDVKAVCLVGQHKVAQEENDCDSQDQSCYCKYTFTEWS